MPSSKYQCLVDATAAAGVKLPPLKPGADVEEIARTLHAEPSMAVSSRAAVGDEAIFIYQTPNGQDARVIASEWMDSKVGKRKEFRGGLFAATDPAWATIVDVQTGKEWHQATGASGYMEPAGVPGGPPVPVNPGTTADTVDRVFKCLDPLVS